MGFFGWVLGVAIVGLGSWLTYYWYTFVEDVKVAAVKVGKAASQFVDKVTNHTADFLADNKSLLIGLAVLAIIGLTIYLLCKCNCINCEFGVTDDEDDVYEDYDLKDWKPNLNQNLNLNQSQYKDKDKDQDIIIHSKDNKDGDQTVKTKKKGLLYFWIFKKSSLQETPNFANV